MKLIPFHIYHLYNKVKIFMALPQRKQVGNQKPQPKSSLCQYLEAAKKGPSENVEADHHTEKLKIDGDKKSQTDTNAKEKQSPQSSKQALHPDLHEDSAIMQRLNVLIIQNKEKSKDMYIKVHQSLQFPSSNLVLEQQSSKGLLLKQKLSQLQRKKLRPQQIKRLICQAVGGGYQSTVFSYTVTQEEKQKSKKQLRQLRQNFFSDEEQSARDISDQNQKGVEYIKNILNEFESNDYAYLFTHQQKLQYFIGKIIDNWGFFQPLYELHFERLLDLIKIKIEFMPSSRVIYKKIYAIQRRLQNTMGYKGSKRKLNVDDHLTDLLFQHYIQQLKTRTTRKGIYFVRDPKTDQRIPLSEYIALCKQYFDPLSGWKDIFFIIGQHFIDKEAQSRSKYDPNNEEILRQFVSNGSSRSFYTQRGLNHPRFSYENSNIHQSEVKEVSPINNIPNIVFPTQTCLGCSQFFYVNYNIYRPQIYKHTLTILGSASQIPNNQTKIKDQICALLNDKGGVLLFDCEKTNSIVIPRGEFIIEKDKTLIQKKLTDYLDGIYPKPQIGKNIVISWVPLLENPFECSQFNSRGIDFVEGVYVGRIVVKPTYGHMSYFWAQDDKPIFSIRTESLFPEGKKQISGRSIHKLIKNKFNDFKEEFMDLHPIERKVLMKPVCTMDHVCKKPKSGFKSHRKNKEQIAAIKHPEQRFNYASVAVAKSSNHETIRVNLLRYKIECVIVAPIEKLKLKGAAQSSIIYHNVRFDQLLSVIRNNKDFEFGGRNLFVIPITQFIRLAERNQRNIMSQGDFNSLTVWLQKQYPKQALKMWRFIAENNDQEFYIETESKESSLYIYIVMTQFLERSSFKNPKGLENMSDRVKQSRFKQVYPSRK